MELRRFPIDSLDGIIAQSGAQLDRENSSDGKGEFFSRNPQAAASGTSNWTSISTPFFLKRGENPDNIRLNLVVEGKGTVWIDDIRLVEGPLEFK